MKRRITILNSLNAYQIYIHVLQKICYVHGIYALYPLIPPSRFFHIMKSFRCLFLKTGP